MCNKIRCCKAFQLSLDFTFLCLGILVLVSYGVTSNWNFEDPRITLGEACLESDSAGFITAVIVWGVSLGIAVTLTSLFGIYSCLTEKMRLLFFYSMMGYVLALAELLFFLILYIHLGRATDSTEACLKEVLVHYYEGPFKSDIVTFSGAWDFLHRYYRCCGVEGGDVFDSMVNWDRTWIEKYEDTFFNTSLKLKEFKVITLLPYTCCVFKDPDSVRYDPDATVEDLMPQLVDQDCPFTPTMANSYIDTGCFELLNEFVKATTTLLLHVSLLAEALQLASALAALYHSKATQNHRLRLKMKADGLLR